jgi:hypothetical protein
MGSESILIWNVRGLNSRARCYVVRELVASKCLSIVCLQETKLGVIYDFDVMQILRPGFRYSFLPANQTRGGILVAWCAMVWSACSALAWPFFISVRFKPASKGTEW